MPAESFWRGRRVLLTGHTGLKGAWAFLWLQQLGAQVTGVALAPDTTPNLAEILGITGSPQSRLADIRDAAALRDVVEAAQPEFVLHMAAQALVRRSYREPVATFDINVRGTLNLLDALRGARDLRACLVVTSDKVYENNDLGRRFVERDPLGGADPYSASKAACEIATSAFARSFFGGAAPGSSAARIATARAGNVIGGGDWSEDRIVPDLWRARRAGQPVALRFPDATRPWQHVLDPLAGYLMFLERLAGGLDETCLNFGPAEAEPVSVRELAEAYQAAYGPGEAAGWVTAEGVHPKEARVLAIDAGRAMRCLGWRPLLAPREAIEWTARWYAAHDGGADMAAFTIAQIRAYEERGGAARGG